MQVREIRSQARQDLGRRLRNVPGELRRELEEHAGAVKAEFEDVVSDWSRQNRPQFTQKVTVTARRITVEVRPYKGRKASTIFGYVDEGTKGPYKIPKAPKTVDSKPPLLVFRTGYQPLTVPVAQAHVGTGTATGPWRRARQVTHPGIKARRFSETIRKRTYPDFRKRIERAIRRALRGQARG